MPRFVQDQPLKSPAPADAEALARQAYDACHPDDSFEDLKRRARFDRHDAGLLHAWLRAVQSVGLHPAKAAAPDRAAGRTDRLAA